MRLSTLALGIAALGACVLTTATASATNYTLWVHGRTSGTPNGSSYWVDSRGFDVSGGVNPVYVNYQGDGHISATNPGVTNAMLAYCTGGNACYIECHSAGCAQVAYTIGLAAPGTTWHINWVRTAGSATGGSELADAGSWLTGYAIDSDLHVGTMRAMFNHDYLGDWTGGHVYNYVGGDWSSITNTFFPCAKKTWGICYSWAGNDSVVAFHSSGHYRSSGGYQSVGASGGTGGSYWDYSRTTFADGNSGSFGHCLVGGFLGSCKEGSEYGNPGGIAEKAASDTRALALLSSVRKRTGVALGALTLLLCGAWVWLRRGTAPPEPEAPRPVARVAPTLRAPSRDRASPTVLASTAPQAEAPPIPSAEQTREQRFLAEMAETRATLLTKFKYPLHSQPLASKSDLILPHHVEPTMRGLNVKGDGKVRIEQKQDRLYLRTGQAAVAQFHIEFEGKPADANVRAGQLFREASGDKPETVIETVRFHDDGAPPDELAGDGTWTAAVPGPSGEPCGMLLRVEIEAHGESGRLSFPFVSTGAAPGKFTGTARAALESGSVAFYAGIALERPGLYEIVGRIYDSGGTPVAYARFYDNLTTDAREVRLLAYGKVLRDEGAVPPLVLRDVEGKRVVLGQYPDREVMDDWDPRFQTPAYDPASFTDKDWDGPEKKDRLDALDKSTEEGLANLRAQEGKK